MRQITAEAILLDVVDLHDRDRIVSLLTAAHGQKRGVAQGARRKYSRFAGQLQPLAKVQVTWFEKEGRDLVRIQDAQLLSDARHLHGDLEGILLGSYLAEHMVVLAQENEASDYLFRLLDTTLEALRAGADRDVAARYYEAWALRLSGIFPPPRECPGCESSLAGGAILPEHGDGLLCVDCGSQFGNGRRVGVAALEFLLRIGREKLAAVAAEPPPEVVLREVERVCGTVRRAFLERELRSYDVMRQTLSDVALADREAPTAKS